MPEIRRKSETLASAEVTEEAHADTLAQAWTLPGQPRDLWPNIEQALESAQSVSPEVTTSEERAKREGIPFVDLEKHRPEPRAIVCVSADLVYHYRVVPVRKDANRLFLAMENPRDIHALDAIRLHTRLMVQPMLAPMSQLAAAIKEHYPRTDASGGRGTVPPVPPVAVSASSAGQDPLPTELQGVLSLWQNGKTVTEIATELELTEATVKARIHRGRLKVRQALERAIEETPRSSETATMLNDLLAAEESIAGSANPILRRALREEMNRALEQLTEEKQAPSEAQHSENPLGEILTELKALRQEVGELRREVAQLRRSERKPFGTALLPFITADDPGLPLG